MTRITPLTPLILLISLALTAPLTAEPATDEADEKRPWTPVWHRDKPANVVNSVLLPTEPFIYPVLSPKNFPTEAEAKAFAATQPRVIEIIKYDKRGWHETFFAVHFLIDIDARVLIPEDEHDNWRDPISQYVIYRALHRNYQPGADVIDNKLMQYTTRIDKSKDNIERAAKSSNETIVSITQANDKGGYRALLRREIDIHAEAKKYRHILEIAHNQLIPDHIPPYRTVGPTGYELIRGPGISLTMGYLSMDRVGRGGSVRVMIPDKPHALDHDYLNHFVLDRGMKIVRYRDQTLISSPDDQVFLWKAGPHSYYYMAGGYTAILDAYLDRFPSILPENYTFDRDAWYREEVRRVIKRLEAHTDKPFGRPVHNRYFRDYFYLCRFIEPIPGAPLFWYNDLPEELSHHEMLAHYEAVQRWWEKHQEAIPLRKAGALNQVQMLRSVPRGREKLEPLLKGLRERAKKVQINDNPEPVLAE